MFLQGISPLGYQLILQGSSATAVLTMASQYLEIQTAMNAAASQLPASTVQCSYFTVGVNALSPSSLRLAVQFQCDNPTPATLLQAYILPTAGPLFVAVISSASAHISLKPTPPIIASH